MKFNVSEILFQKTGFVSPLIIDEHTKIHGNDISLVGKGQFLRTDKGIWVSASVETEIKMDCSRCLAPFPFHVNFNIEEEVIPVDGPSNQSFVGEQQYSGISLIDSNNILDISDMVIQYIDVSVPINGNCNVQCKGLCAQCGINLNLNKCQCDAGPVDEGWNILSATRIIERK